MKNKAHRITSKIDDGERILLKNFNALTINK